MRFRRHNYFQYILQLLYPHLCEGCGNELHRANPLLCTRCILQLPATGFFDLPQNPVAKIFYGRLPIYQAGALYYFTKHSLLQHLLVELKYKGNREAGFFLGRMMGLALRQSPYYANVHALIPLPLHPKKEQKRGYNQAAVLCEGIHSVWPVPIRHHAIIRNRFTTTQTHQTRIGRWQNMEHVFSIPEASILTDQHLLIVDDVVTTGATLEACGAPLLALPGVKVSIASAAYTI